MTETVASKARSAWVIPETLNVRSGPGTDRRQIGTLKRGQKVHVTSTSNKWCWAKLPDGTWGWVAEWLLEFSADKGRTLAAQAASAPASQPRGNPPAWIKVSAANVRKGPGLGAERYPRSLPSGTKVYITERQGEWVRCRTPGGFGWIHNDLLEYDITAGQRLAAANGASSASSGGASSSGTPSAKAYVINDGVHLRAGPGTSHTSRARLTKGQTVYVTERNGQWCRATVHGGGSGWIAGWLLKFESGEGSSQPAAPAASVASSPTAPEENRTPNPLTAWVTAQTANVRERPSESSALKFQLSQGTKLQMVAVNGHWCKIRTDSGDFGWIAGWLIKFVPPGQAITTNEGGEEVEVHVGWVARPTVNLRESPSTNARVTGTASLRTRLIIIGKKNDWYKVALETGETGWMAGWLIDTRSERVARAGSGSGSSGSSAGFPAPTTDSGATAAAPSGGGLGSRLVQTAMSYCGKIPYVRGSSSTSGADCSGFVSLIHRMHGVSISRSSQSLFREGTPVSRSELEPGDVVFFRNTYRSGISHVGIYVGNGNFVHSANRRGGVKVTGLNSSYYAPRYAGARRMF